MAGLSYVDCIKKVRYDCFESVGYAFRKRKHGRGFSFKKKFPVNHVVATLSIRLCCRFCKIPEMALQSRPSQVVADPYLEAYANNIIPWLLPWRTYYY